MPNLPKTLSAMIDDIAKTEDSYDKLTKAIILNAIEIRILSKNLSNSMITCSSIVCVCMAICVSLIANILR